MNAGVTGLPAGLAGSTFTVTGEDVWKPVEEDDGLLPSIV
jgi:hypothetical protein